jgi:hypothetical protein
MLSTKCTLARVSLLVSLCLCPVRGATPRNAAIAGATATATNAEINYCFARVRGLDPGRLPPAYLVLSFASRCRTAMPELAP